MLYCDGYRERPGVAGRDIRDVDLPEFVASNNVLDSVHRARH